MNQAYQLSRAIRHLNENPRDFEGRRRLEDALSFCPAAQFAHGRMAQRALAEMVHRAASFVVTRWDDENQRANWISVANDLLKRLEKPKRLPAKRRPRRAVSDAVDLKKRAAGDE